MTTASILLVDDETNFVDIMTKRLRKKGFTVYPAYSGLGALEQLNDHTDIEVVILDVKMPVMNGIEVLNCIKKVHPLTEVVMLSGHATMEIAIEGMKRGAFDFLLKPCDLDSLSVRIKEAVAKKRGHEQKIQAARKLLGKNDLFQENPNAERK